MESPVSDPCEGEREAVNSFKTIRHRLKLGFSKPAQPYLLDDHKELHREYKRCLREILSHPALVSLEVLAYIGNSPTDQKHQKLQGILSSGFDVKSCISFYLFYSRYPETNQRLYQEKISKVRKWQVRVRGFKLALQLDGK